MSAADTLATGACAFAFHAEDGLGGVAVTSRPWPQSGPFVVGAGASPCPVRTVPGPPSSGGYSWRPYPWGRRCLPFLLSWILSWGSRLWHLFSFYCSSLIFCCLYKHNTFFWCVWWERIVIQRHLTTFTWKTRKIFLI